MAGASTQQQTGQAPNVFQQSANAYGGALAGTAGAMGYQPQQVQAGQLATTNLDPYMNPYTQQVIDAQAADVMRNAQLGLNQLDYQAQQAGAFGGSRHGIAMGELGRGALEQLGQQSAALRQAGFESAQRAAQSDIASQMQANLANQQAGLQGASQLLSASGQMGNLANMGFGFGRQTQQDLAQQGALQQALQQSIIDAANAQYQGFQGYPAESLGYMASALGAAPVPQTQQTTRQLGLMDYLGAGLGAYGAYMMSDRRLKQNIQKVGEFPSGQNVYSWDWNSAANGLGLEGSSVGVMADETDAAFVATHPSGYSMVNYAKLVA